LKYRNSIAVSGKEFKRSVVLLLFFWVRAAYSQDLEQLTKKQKVKVTGGVSANQMFYFSDGQNQRRDPYSYTLSGRLAIAYGGLSVPLSFSYTNQRFSYGQPFNIVGMSPKYKWVTAHLGFRSMNFSPYTLNGHQFLGAGLEVLPPKTGLKISAMYGRMLKAVEADGNNRPSYERYGMGLKVEHKNDKTTLGLSMFTAKDYYNSINTPLDRYNITPQENVAIGVNVSKRIGSHLTANADVARSAYTRDTRLVASEEKAKGLDQAFLIDKRISTSYYNAYKLGLTYQMKVLSVGIGYERIDPGYKTLGAYYFINDLEGITVNASTSFWHNKITLGANVGKQRDNLDKTKTATQNRWVSSFNLGFNPTPKWNMSLSYSNFQSYTNVRPNGGAQGVYTRFDADTLNFVQIAQSAQGNVMRVLKSDENSQSTVNLGISVQVSTQKAGTQTIYSPTFYNSNLGYTLSLPKKNTSFNAGVNGNVSGEGENQTMFLGPIVGTNKTFFKNTLRCGINGSWNRVYLKGKPTSSILSFSQTNSITLKKKHGVNANITYTRMETPVNTNVLAFNRPINDFMANVGYSYSF